MIVRMRARLAARADKAKGRPGNAGLFHSFCNPDSNHFCRFSIFVFDEDREQFCHVAGNMPNAYASRLDLSIFSFDNSVRSIF
jgi:hypothetical protein